MHLITDYNKKEYFKMVTECALVMQRNYSLESKIKARELMKCLDALNQDNKNGNNKMTAMTIVAIMKMSNVPIVTTTFYRNQE